MGTQSKKVRAFIAVDLPDGIKSRLLGVSSAIDVPGMRAVDAKQLHITLFFLDEIDEAQADGVKAVLRNLDAHSFEVSLDGIGTFDISRPRVLFANIIAGYESLLDIYANMFGGIEALKIKMEDREFSPHVTLARLKGFGSRERSAARKAIEEYAHHDFGSFTCSSIKLKQSVLSQEGPAYSDLFVKELSP